MFSKNGYGTVDSSLLGSTGYLIPNTKEYITFFGGPGTGISGSAEGKISTPSKIKNLSTMGPDEISENSRGRANIYDEDIYQTEGLPSDYGKGSRTSNIRANFDDGVTVEFWLQANSPQTDPGAGKTFGFSPKQVLFDWHNGESHSSDHYSRIIIEMTSSTSATGGELNPFILTVQSGAVTSRNMLTLGDPSLHTTHLDGDTWAHYAFKIFNSGSTLKANLYVDGNYADQNSWGDYDLSSSMTTQIISGSSTDSVYGRVGAAASYPEKAIDYTYASQTSLKGWWRMRGDDTDAREDHSGNGRTLNSSFSNVGSSDPGAPFLSYIQQTETANQKSRVFGGTAADRYRLNVASHWDAVIGRASSGGTEKYTLSSWVYKTGDGDGTYGRIWDFSTSDIAIYTGPNERIYVQFRIYDESTSSSAYITYYTATGAISLNEWAHIVLTQDLSDVTQKPKVYVNGVEQSLTKSGASVTPTSKDYFAGIEGDACFIGNRDDFDRNWQGNLADFAVWDSILTEEEIKAIYYASDSAWNKKVNNPITELNAKNAQGRIVALLYPPAPGVYGSLYLKGAGKLSASMDEFRYWKTGRTAEQIGANWFDQVRGGANTDISNATLGVYYKFNEGITNTSSVDRIVLDYAGRVTNGHWAGYTNVSRNTGSAILSASAAIKEYEDPIIRTNHPKISELKESLLASGSAHDYNNNGSFLSLMPGWIVDEEEVVTGSDLQNMAHIAGAYFDKLYLQISALPSLRHITYTSSSHKPTSFAEHLPQSLGLYSPQMFVEADIIEKFLNKNDQKLFEGDLDETKNLIYSNLYNNLTNIYKSKGTEKSIRNVLRCFNVDEKLIRLNVRSSDRKFVLSNNLEQVLIRKPMINFASSSQTEAVVYQRASPHHSDAKGYIACESIPANVSASFGFTTEVGVIFPSYNENISKVYRNFETSSLFGIQTVDSTSTNSKNGSDTTFVATNNNYANFQVRAIRQKDAFGRLTKNIKFQLTQSHVPSSFTFPELTSSIFMEAYDNQYWNVSVRVRPVSSSVNYAFVSSSATTGKERTPAYEVIFKGINTLENEILNSFELSGTMLSLAGQQFLQTPKRLYVGAERTNINGTLIHRTDVMVPYARLWLKSVDDYTLLQHAHDMENLGISGSNKHLSPLDPSVEEAAAANLTNRSTLALNWNFLDITGSNAAGNFYTQDFSSGSVKNQNNFGWLGTISTGYQHTGYGYGFVTSSTAPVKKEPINTYRFMDPESVVSSDMIKIFDDSDKLFDPTETPPDFSYALEKSPYAAISEEILDFFAGAVDFHNLIGNPVNKYRERYKEMEKLRQTFFRRVNKVSDVERYIEYYKWFDTALSSVISQIIPASANFIEDTQNIIESHVLERNKYKHQLPIIKTRSPDIDAYLVGSFYKAFGWEEDVSSLPSSPRSTKIRERYWKTAASASAAEITSGDTHVDTARDKLRKVLRSTRTKTGSAPLVLTKEDGTIYTRKWNQSDRFSKTFDFTADITNVVGSGAIGGGVNFDTVGKNFAYAYSAVYPAGPINHQGGKFVPMNVLVAFSNDLVQPKNVVSEFQPADFVDKSKKIYKLNHGRDWEGGLGYSNIKSDVGFPFNIISSSVDTAANKLVWDRMGANIEITNLHNDVYGDDMEIPLQGPFTQYAVGGHQSRHVPLNVKLDTNTFYSSGLDNYLTRPEAWKILIGACGPTAPTGAIALVGPDYPWPEANAVGAVPYPMTGAQKAWLYRDFVAKRPLNFKTIQMTGSVGGTILGNYRKAYEYIQIPGAHSNPRKFVEKQPNLPSALDNTDTTIARTFLGVRRDAQAHTPFIQEYSTNYLTGTDDNSSVMVSKFSAPGGIEVMSLGYRDFRSTEYSVYNVLPFKNLSVIKKSQGSAGSVEPVGSTPSEARVSDIHGKDFGMRSHFARHSAKFGRDSLTVTNPGESYNQLPSKYKINRNTVRRMKVATTKLVSVGGALQEQITYDTGSKFDNWNVQYQIPRTDIQYAWLSRSLADPHNIRYTNMQNFVNLNWLGYYSSSAGYLPFYNFVTASDVGNLSNLGGRLQPVHRISTLTLDAYSSSTNTLGFTTSTTGSDYINTSLNSANKIEDGSYLNLLLARRSAKHGWTWKSVIRNDTPVSINSYKTKTLSVITSSEARMDSFRLPPVSVRGRPVIVNFDAPQASSYSTDVDFNNTSVKATHNNEKIYFNERKLNTRTQDNPNNEMTPYQQVIGVVNSTPDYKLNWILYTENVFPSLRNEFFSGTTSRIGYDNRFWRDARADRTIDLYGNHFGSTWTYNSIRADRAVLSEWPLDAPEDFLTRTGPTKITNVLNLYNLRRLNTAGELQSTYYSYFTGSMDNKTGTTYNTYINGGAFAVPYSDNNQVFDIMDQQTISGLYARKHMNSARYSAATPCGVRMNGTGGYGYYPDRITANRSRENTSTNTFKTGGVYFPIETYAGEALWEAGTTAGVWEYSQSINANSTSSIFLSHSSAPWKFDTYSDYIEDLNLVARGYAIVPEYRISDHVEDYVRYGTLNKGKTNTFSIPGTGINSSTGSFYKDYSNSEFMKEFLNVRSDAIIGAKEIKLVCSAAIRYNPYKGFYPAQRTLDLTGRFMNSYLSYLNTSFTLDGKTVVDANLDPYVDGGNFAPMWRTLFAPGIMYNSIKSGMAVDYPIVLDPTKIGRKQDYAGLDEACGLYSPLNTSGTTNIYGYKGGTYFDKRLPFETMINPTDHLDGLSFFDLESHLSMSLPVTCSWTNGGGDVGLYPMMASNFFGEVGNFFLKDSTFTRLESNVVSDDLKFKEGEVYGARVRIMASSDGSRMYNRERDSRKKDNVHNPDTANSGAYIDFGARAYTASAPSTNPYQGGYAAYSGAYFPIPQDPKNLAFYEFKKNFNLYSRPTAFGPPISGRSHSNAAAALTASLHGCYDSFEGYNWAFTPPYTNGEAWADLIFRPSASVSYDLEKILAETQVVYWRCDPGAPSGSGYSSHITNLIYGGPGSDIASDNPIYSGPNINPNAMQLSASFNLFGIERVFKTTNDRFGNENQQTNESVGKKWIIQPKFETPMMNFTDEDTQYARDPTLRPVSSVHGTLTLPIFGSASVPRGMWHQFGTAMEEPDKGVFVDIGPIPAQWLKYHYRVLNTGSLYNNYNVGESRKNLFKDMKSLTDIANFQKTGQQKRLGELKDSMSVHEAVVAIPYVIDVPTTSENKITNSQKQKRKKFINIPKKRFESAMAKVGSKEGDSLSTAGASIRELVQKMDKYILPPQFDFKNNKKVKPFVMYIFEFKYDFDQDDLSYIWQNIAPRNSEKMSFQTTAVSHNLMNTELLNEKNLLTNENLRWMVFKVKQRSKASYYDLIPDQAAQASKEIFGSKISKEGYEIQYNWPYDYLSFVELIKMDAQVLYRTDNQPPEKKPQSELPDIEKKQKAVQQQKIKKRESLRNKEMKRPPSARQAGRPRGGNGSGGSGGGSGGGAY